LAALCLVAAHAAAAQSNGPLCQDSVGVASSDSITAAVIAVLSPFDDGQNVPPEVIRFVLIEIGRRIRPPSPLPLTVYSPIGDPDTKSDSMMLVHVVVNGMFGFTLKRDGRLTEPAVLSSTLNPVFDSRVIEAMREVDSTGVLAPIAEHLKHRSVEMRLRLHTARRASDTGAVLFRLRAPVVRLTEHVYPQPGNWGPRYPDILRNGGVEGDVLLQVVVSDSGRADLRTPIALAATNTGFARAVMDYLPHMRFRPGHVAGCPLRILVQMPFGFRLTR
jgi:TonB family protein